MAIVLQVPNNPYRAPKEIQKTEKMETQNQQKTKVQIKYVFSPKQDCPWKFSVTQIMMVFMMFQLSGTF